MSGDRAGPETCTVVVYYADLADDRAEDPGSVLSPDEAERAGRYRSAADLRRSVRARCLLREVLAGYTACRPGEIRFGYGAHGKPFLSGEPPEGVQFSVSHAGDLAAVAVARGRRVGIDIEALRTGSTEPALPLCFLTDAEAAAVKTLPAHAQAGLFLRIWTRKEALLKATGQGIGGLADCPGVRDSGTVFHDGAVWQIQDLRCPPGYTGALAAEGTGSVVQIVQLPG